MDDVGKVLMALSEKDDEIASLKAALVSMTHSREEWRKLATEYFETLRQNNGR